MALMLLTRVQSLTIIYILQISSKSLMVYFYIPAAFFVKRIK